MYLNMFAQMQRINIFAQLKKTVQKYLEKISTHLHLPHFFLLGANLSKKIF